MERTTPREPSGIIAEDVSEQHGPLASNATWETFLEF